MTAIRWATAAEAPASAAPVAHVAAAFGRQIDEVAAGLHSWADRQHHHPSMSATARDVVHSLLENTEVGR
jgi:hypothetical protein